MQRLLFTLLLLFLCHIVFSQVVKYGNDFLSIGAGARALSLGGGCIATSSGAEASFWNPANLQHFGKLEISATHDNYFSGLANYDFVAAAYSVDTVSDLGLSLVRLGVDDIQNTLQLFDAEGNMDFDRISYFSVADYAIFFSYGRKIQHIRGLSVGSSVKLIYRHEGKFANAVGFGVDLAASWRRKSFSAGVVLRDATSTFDVWNVDKSQFDSVFVSTGNTIPENSTEIIPPSLRFSVAYKFKIKDFIISPETGATVFFDGHRNYLVSGEMLSINPFFACEFSYKGIVFLRGGLTDFQKNNNLYLSKSFSFVFSCGAGIAFKHFSFDYTFLNTSKDSYDYKSNVFTLKVNFLN